MRLSVRVIIPQHHVRLGRWLFQPWDLECESVCVCLCSLGMWGGGAPGQKLPGVDCQVLCSLISPAFQRRVYTQTHTDKPTHGPLMMNFAQSRLPLCMQLNNIYSGKAAKVNVLSQA